MVIRPAFLQAWQRFSEINIDVSSVGKKIGGNVGANITLGEQDPAQGFTNACAIRMSYTLNYSGAKVERGVWKTVSGDDKNWYIYRVKDLLTYMHKKYGKPDKIVKNPKPGDFQNLKGILVFAVNGWSDASGHATLWNGSVCSDHCYFPISNEGSIWLLK
ncbi:type VI secretion system amidase effector protein Tae4 [Erwinia tasmaniensis]|uniref:Cytoplasmic protein n=1 Tax=Erwinia tasmaniensis (strain DSM 17950 / CFBP 7177 / CIP 109463 / NCPPB 4357 / Et1/99) TaxID=465817 RepID=B2VH84_ERWT9|nr:type VI secretion system amidase effector protein Tae4 [Erwinia tasmaniensis]CAO95667.1 Putative cytoplasmic protein [Erwinia tasmaniensis Et1/99]